MRGFTLVLQGVAVVMLLISLGLAPMVNALTHGPAAVVAEADHAAWHAEKGEVWQAEGHQHHDSTDHDHSTVIILPADQTEVVTLSSAVELTDLPALNDTIRDGPRRPPRALV